jgi:hypothetical protein
MANTLMMTDLEVVQAPKFFRKIMIESIFYWIVVAELTQ